MVLKCHAMLNKLLSLVGSPFKLADLYQLGTNLSDYVDGIRTEGFYMLDELRKVNLGYFDETIRPTTPSLLIRTTEASLNRLVQITNRSSAYLGD
jgi:hypothetical protein